MAASLHCLPRAASPSRAPAPSHADECFEQRLAGPYHAAFPAPAHAHPGHLVVDKPDLGPQHWAAAAQSGCAGQCGCGGGGGCSRHGGRSEAERPCRRCAKEAALRGYEGPTLFAVPGNHDYLDGLASFQKNILARGWLGGWLMPQARRSSSAARPALPPCSRAAPVSRWACVWLQPCDFVCPAWLHPAPPPPSPLRLQEKSYFALHLPHGWWVFGFDLALVRGSRKGGGRGREPGQRARRLRGVPGWDGLGVAAARAAAPG
jgi:hypothetical protein